ncbi:hypothetical protein VPNG_09586 [Cytospora leucostoma]|uniref:Uncharacterized protein n=1 Tax=Cytospora leucostoma TaxID=1230097 RepID=A0A423VN30_9PEZI|nr:hypothetical protein VPNG_09586 [Cytospora leucostoma]
MASNKPSMSVTEEDGDSPTTNGTLQMQSCNSATDIIITTTTITTKNAAPPTRRIKIESHTCGQYPLTTISGLTSLSNIFYIVFKRRLHCPGKCANNKIELWNAHPRDVDYIVYWSIAKLAGSFADMQELTVQLKEVSFYTTQSLVLMWLGTDIRDIICFGLSREAWRTLESKFALRRYVNLLVSISDCPRVV